MQGREAALITSGSRDNLPEESDNVVDPLVRVVDPLAPSPLSSPCRK